MLQYLCQLLELDAVLDLDPNVRPGTVRHGAAPSVLAIARTPQIRMGTTSLELFGSGGQVIDTASLTTPSLDERGPLRLRPQSGKNGEHAAM